MASPFRVFRRYMKPLLAVFVVVLMLSWVIGDSLRSFIGGGPSGQGAAARHPESVAVRWEGGQLTNIDLQNLVERRHLVNNLVRTVEFEGRRAMVEAGLEPRNLRVDPLIGPETEGQGVEENVVYTKLLADLARKAGMQISDDALVRYLDDLGRGRVSREKMKQIVHSMQTRGGRTSAATALDALRDEMLARNFLSSYQFALSTVTPEQRWKDWLRSNDRVTLEVAAFPAEDFLVNVPEPTDADLQKFVQPPESPDVDLLKREPQPDMLPGGMEMPSRYPGFAIPRRIDVQFIEANYDKFLAKAEAEITDEQIAKYYDDHKDPLFIEVDTGLIDATEKPAAESDATGETTDQTGAADDKTGDTAPAGNTGESAPPSESQPPAGDSVDRPEGKSSSRRNDVSSPFRLVAFQENADSAKSVENTVGTSADSAAESTPPSANTPAQESSSANEPTSSGKPKEFLPLDKVRDEIRHQLASERVAQQLIELMEKLDGQMNSEHTNYVSAMLNAQVDNKETPKPTGLLADLKPLADEHGLDYGTTGPLSVLEMRKTPVGESFDPEARAELWRILFGSKDLELYQPKLTMDLLGNRYLSMKTSDTPGRVPTLKEVRNEVVRAWKLKKAGEDALKRAKEVAQKANDSGAPLSDFFADDKSVAVVRTDPFSWLTGGEVSRITGQQQPLRLSEPEGVVAAGPEFMAAAFELEDGKVGAASNHDGSIAYVIRLADHQLSPEALRTAYLSEANTWPALPTMISARTQDASRRLMSDITSVANIKWERPHDEVAETN